MLASKTDDMTFFVPNSAVATCASKEIFLVVSKERKRSVPCVVRNGTVTGMAGLFHQGPVHGLDA